MAPMTSLRTAQCFFCPTPALGQYVLTRDAPVSLATRRDGDTRTRLALPICAAHHTVLQRAGARGRIYKPTGVRWWLGAR